jgi:hypothetical protein
MKQTATISTTQSLSLRAKLEVVRLAINSDELLRANVRIGNAHAIESCSKTKTYQDEQ